jgi:iron complex outermembrane receptor protein
VGNWGHFGVSYSDIESVFGIPFHGDEHGDDEHGDEDHGDDDHGDDDHGDDDHGDDDHGDDDHGDEHEGERIFSSTESKRFDIDGSFNLNLGPINKLSYTYRDSDYSHTEAHEEEDEDGHGDEHGDEDEHGHEGPTTFSNDSSELRFVVNLDNDSVNQSVVLNLVNEDTSIIGEEAFMNPVDSSETSLGYYVSKDFANLKFDVGVRIDSVERDGSITEHDDHDGDDHDGDDHDGDDHDGDHADETTQHSYSSDMTSFAASISRDFGDSLSVTAGGARVNRAPSSSELFMNGPHLATGRFEVGDPSLTTETHNNFDISFNYAANGYSASLTFFNCSVDDFIYLVDETEEEHADHDDDHGGLIMAEYKQQDADFNGYELELSKSFDLASGVVKLTYARDTVIGEFTDGSDVPRIAPARNIYSVAYGGESIYASLRLKDVEEQTRVATNGTATDGYQMLDFSMRKSFNVAGGPSLNVSIFGNNLLDEVARNHTSFVKNEVPLPGRNYGLKFNFEI